jgi:hypothetical protein
MIAAVGTITQTPALNSTPRAQASSATAPSTGRALVAVAPVARAAAPRSPSQRVAAPFLAQLIATDQMLPQTRIRNRAEPRDVIAAYGDAARMLCNKN